MTARAVGVPSLPTAWRPYAALVVVLNGTWGALAALPTSLYGFSNGMIYAVWSATMLLPAAVVVARQGIDLRRRATARAIVLGLFGAGGQLLLFVALASGPAYLVFPVVSAVPVLTVLLAVLRLHERPGRAGAAGIAAVLVALVLLGGTDSGGTETSGPWLPVALLVVLVWGTQGYLMREAAVDGVGEATTFAWMTVGGLLLAPVALLTAGGLRAEVTAPALLLTAGVQLLNAVSALLLVVAMRRGRASVVSPVTGALSPAVSVVLSLVLTRTLPSATTVVAILLALGGSALLTRADARASDAQPG